MSAASQDSAGALTASQKDLVEEIVREFQQHLQREEGSAGLAACLEKIADLPQARPELLRRLVEVELRHLHQKNITWPPLADYQDRFKEFEEVIRQVYESLARVVAGPGTGGDLLWQQGHRFGLDGKFQVMELLGEGSFGRVYRCRDVSLGRDVAVKVLKKELLASDAERERFRGEGRALASLDHANIVPVYDVDEREGYLVTKFIRGQTLQVALQSAEQPFSVPQTVRIVYLIAAALQEAHRKDVVHRDVKPGNILLDGEWPYLVDFGLALRGENVGRFEGVIGTAAYMSPEQARGESGQVDGRSDLYSLGVVFYELLTGRRPFCQRVLSELLAQISNPDLPSPPPRQYNPAIPPALADVCLKALEKDSRRRYQAAVDLMEALQSWQQQVARRDSDTVEPSDSGASRGDPAARPVGSFPGLRCFGEQDTAFFLTLLSDPRSLDLWKTRIEEQEPQRAFRIGVIYGPSGSGKSSLVRAGLLPRLDDSDVVQFKVVVEATTHQGETERRLLEGLRRQGKDLPAALGLAQLLQRLKTERGLLGWKKTLLVIDQFEQWLHGSAASGDGELAQALRHCDGEWLQCLLVVRQDYYATAARFVDRALGMSLSERDNLLYVEPFDRHHAKAVLIAFGRVLGRLGPPPAPLTDEQQKFVQSAVEGLSQDGKVVPVQITLFALMVKAEEWVPATLDEVSGVEGLGVKFIEKNFGQRAPLHRRQHQPAVRAVLNLLVPAQGDDLRGHQRTYDDLLVASGYSREEFDKMIGLLDSELYLITPSDGENPAGAEDGVTVAERRYQLTHDFLVHPVREWLVQQKKASRRGRAELRLQERETAWTRSKKDSRHLPTMREFLGIWLLVPRANWSQRQKAMMGAASWRHLLRVALLGCLLTVLGFGIATEQNRAKLSVQTLLSVNETNRAVETLTAISASNPFFRWRARSEAREVIADQSRSRVQKLRSQVVLVAVGEAASAEELVKGLSGDLTEQEFEFTLQLLDALPPQQLDAVKEELWNLALQPPRDFSTALPAWFRAACAVAFLDAANERNWNDVKSDVIQHLIKQGPPPDSLWVRTCLCKVGDVLTPDLLGQLGDRDPRVRVTAVHLCKPLNVKPKRLHDLVSKKEIETLRSAMLALGTCDALQPRWQQTFEELLRHEDPGVHSAAEWVLRQRYGQDSHMPRPKRKLPKRGPRWWFTNEQRDTLVVFGDPTCQDGERGITFQMGAKEAAGRGMIDHERRIRRVFAVANKEVTFKQLQPFRAYLHKQKIEWKFSVIQEKPAAAKYGPCAACTIDAYRAMQYCRWLSESDPQIPKGVDLCYPSVKDLEECRQGRKMLTLPCGYRSLPGYRLPTEAELEYVCRAPNGKQEQPFWGENTGLLGHYAWCKENTPSARGYLNPVGRKMPNDFGLFDVLGNVREWTSSLAVPHDQEWRKSQRQAWVDDEEPHRERSAGADAKWIVRGGSWDDSSSKDNLKPHYRRIQHPFVVGSDIGFRVARTLTDKELQAMNR